jgi:nucleotide-binding universal stress UspA family protein
MSFRHIAVASDFSEGADAAFITARDLARQHGARLSVVHVIPPLITPSPLLDDLVVGELDLRLRENLSQNADREIARRYLSQAEGVVTQAVVLEGDPTSELMAWVAQQEVDLLVVGSTGLSGLAEVFFGSVAARAVRRAPCSVLVARRRATAKS